MSAQTDKEFVLSREPSAYEGWCDTCSSWHVFDENYYISTAGTKQAAWANAAATIRQREQVKQEKE